MGDEGGGEEAVVVGGVGAGWGLGGVGGGDAPAEVGVGGAFGGDLVGAGGGLVSL